MTAWKDVERAEPEFAQRVPGTLRRSQAQDDSAGDAQALRLQLLDEIRAAVGFDATPGC